MNENNRPPLVVLTGPTAVGKTGLAVELARKIGGEIISADSMQVYRHMDIGSAKITPQQMKGVPHHLIDIMDPAEDFNVVMFQKLAKQAVYDILGRGRIPIVAGGTGFYIQALVYDVDFTQNDEDEALRKQLEEIAATQGNEALYERLRRIDPESCKVIHANNVKRVIRAIEFYEKTGEKISAHNENQRRNASPYNFAYFVLNDDRARLYARIDARVDGMIVDGLVGEVRRLADMGCSAGMVSMQGLGYKEILAYLNGECSLEEAVGRIKRDTRHFAKRQLTWFRRERETVWLDKQDYGYDDDRILCQIICSLQQKGIIDGPQGEKAGR